ncbi:MAG: hypothetical protein PHU75_05700 [Candidatus Nanopelagicales bacterium]|nr:hypothetical protein [Candidatus Nanopelagicales bacterium]
MGARALSVVTVGLVGAALLAPAASAAQSPVPGSADAYYSPTTTEQFSKNPLELRRFLTNDQPQYDEQSYVWAGSLIDYSGTTNAVAVEMQRNDDLTNPLGPIPAVSAAILFNQGDHPGYVIGGLGGVPDITLPVSVMSSPWSARVQSFTPGQLPDFVDVRVVAGEFGRRGAVYEITSNSPNVASSAPVGERLTSYIRVKDVTGIGQWGYGPSGYMPMWLFPPQLAAIMGKYHGSVGDYLKATKDPMRGQGTYYFTEPLLQVQRFKMSINGKVVSAGAGGWLWLDNVERSFNEQAQQIVNNGVSWLEFSVQIPDTHEALKIGYTKQASVGQFPYAMLMSPASVKAPDGGWTSQMTWNQQNIHFRPVKGSEWTNPATGHTYYLKYRVDLDPSPGAQKATFFMSPMLRDQEAVVSGRAVFEGLFKMTGTIGSRPVTGYAWGELQPVGSL